MTKGTFTLIVIVLITIPLLALNHFGLLEASAKFMFVPLFALYYVGQYAERRFPEKN
jgi:hypothetical protein